MTFRCDDKSSLIAYLYGECTPDEREAVEEHLAWCAACAAEVDDLRGVRRSLREWAPPEHALGFRVVREEVRQRSLWPAMPAWAQLAAAVLVIAVGAAIANLDVRVGTSGVEIRTGWNRPAAVTRSASGVTPVSGAAPWRSDLAALERSLRHDLAPAPASLPIAGSLAAPVSAGGRTTPTADPDLMRRVQILMDEHDRRQQQAFETMLATRMVQLARDIEVQRRTDLLRIQQGLGQVEGRTTSEVAQLREMQRYFMRVANIQEIK